MKIFSAKTIILCLWTCLFVCIADEVSKTYQINFGTVTMLNDSWGHTEKEYHISGQLHFTYDIPTNAVFDWVDVELDEEIYIDPNTGNSKSLDKLFQMTELELVDANETQIHMIYEKNIPTHPQADVNITVALQDDDLLITGGFSAVAADGPGYALYAIAELIQDTGGTNPNALKFGDFDGRKNYKLTVPDVNGVPVTFSLTGGGQGEVNDAYFQKIDLYNTTKNSVFKITTRGKGAETRVGNITVNGHIKAIDAKTTDLLGHIQIDGSLEQLQFDDAVSDSNIAIGAPPGNFLNDPNFDVVMKFDQVKGLAVDSQSPIKLLKATEWLRSERNDLESWINAPSIKRLFITGSRKRDIAGDFGINLSLSGSTIVPTDPNSSPPAALENAIISGDISNCDWNITDLAQTIRIKGSINDLILNIDGDVNSLRFNDIDNSELNVNGSISLLKCNDVYNSTVAIPEGSISSLRINGWYDSTMEVDNLRNARVAILHGTINAEYDIKNITIGEPMALIGPNSDEPLGFISVAGKANVRSSTGTIRFTDGTVYTTEPNMYRLEDLRGYNIPDEWWEYTSSYRIRSSGGNDSGTIYSTVNVLNVDDFNNGNSFTIEKLCVDDTSFVTSWYNDSKGTKLRSFASNTTLGLLELVLDANMPGREFLKPRETYKDAGPFYGDWDIIFDDKNNKTQEIDVSDITGMVKTMISLVCHEQITLPTGVYLAAKVKSSIKMNGTANVTIGDEEYPGKFSLSQAQVFWAVPEIGIIKAATNTSYRIRANRKTYYFKIAQIDQLTNSINLVEIPPETENN